MQSILRAAAFASAFLFTAQAASAATDTEILEARLKKAQASAQSVSALGNANDWLAAASRLAKDAPSGATRCVDARTETFGGKYAISYDAAGNPCRIYDLSFATLQTITAKSQITQLPVQSFGARDYLAWMDGRYDQVLAKISAFPAALSNGDKSELAGWTQKLEFKAARVNSLMANSNEIGLPSSFSAADLQLGANFKFNAKERKNLKDAMAIADRSVQGGLFSANEAAEWENAIDNPETLLEHIKFNWNDAKKVYDVFLDGQFLPVRGPIALVDYSATYKLTVERVLRSILQSALGKLVQFVPGQAQHIVSVALTDSFMFIEMAYDYQINQLEGTLRKVQSAEVASTLDAKAAERGMNILFGAKADLVNAYILAAVQKKPFDWRQFEEMGRKTRYATEKARDIMLTNLNSQMVQKDGCEMTLVDGYFGICAKDGKQSLHSMISSSTFLFWNLGGPTVFEYGSPNSVLMKRSASYLLSVAAGMLELPYLSSITNFLAGSLKSYATAGITDEAFHRNTLFLDKAKRGLNSKELEVYSKLYLQNLNLLLSKTESQEAAVINANLSLLKK
jgi:hypothetical protein